MLSKSSPAQAVRAADVEDRRRRKREAQARWRAGKKAQALLGIPDWRAEFRRRYPIPFGWSERVARAWSLTEDPTPTTQAEADAWRQAHGL